MQPLAQPSRAHKTHHPRLSSRHSLLYNVRDDTVLDPLHRVGSRVQAKDSQDYPATAINTELGACEDTEGRKE